MLSRSKWLAIAAVFFLATTYVYIYMSTASTQPACNYPAHEGSNINPLTYPQVNLVRRNASLPGFSQQVLQRRSVRLIRESRYLVLAKLREWREKNQIETKDAAETMAIFSELTNLLEVNVEGLGRVDGSSAAQKAALQNLTDAFLKTLTKQQNPKDCSSAKHLIMDINKACGFGCQLHHSVHCFRLAFASGRVLHLKDDRWSYSTSGFSSIFKQLTPCPLPLAKERGLYKMWGDPGHETEQHVFCPIVERLSTLPPFAHPAVPTSIAGHLERLHAAPSVWLIGHFLAYLMRLQEGAVSNTVGATIQGVQGNSPVVGIHVRRTDKVRSEAAFHKLDEYMTYVNRYFDKLDIEAVMRSRSNEWRDDDFPELPYPGPITRRVYIATDDPSVFEEARKSYPAPRYEFLGDSKRAESAALSSRYTHDSAVAVIADVFALSYTDHIVCTFSSQICRLSYELMQTRPNLLGDASTRVQSLDDTYYYGGQLAWDPIAIIEDKEVGINVGDKVSYLGNHWNGYAKVIPVNREGSSKNTIRPSFRFEPIVLQVDFGPPINVPTLP